MHDSPVNGSLLGLMSLLEAIPFWILGALASGCAVYYTVVAVRVWRTHRILPTARDGATMPLPPGDPPSVCVVIPAHNEAGEIAGLVHSLLAQEYPSLSIVLALDRCTDQTEALAREAAAGDPRIEIITIDHCPDDWAGKVHAVHSGVQRSSAARSADLLLFADADTRFDPQCVRATVALLYARKLDMLSLLSTLTNGAAFERIAQPAAGLELVRQYPLDRLNRPGSQVRFANGQFMLFRRETYEQIGGHEEVRHELLEDLGFARVLRQPRHAKEFGCLMADGMLGCRMYEDWPAFRRGWKRIYTEAARRRVAHLRKDAWRLRMIGVCLPLISDAAFLAGIALWIWADDRPLTIAMLLCGLAGGIAFLAAMFQIYRMQRIPVIWSLLYPLGAWKVAGILSEAAADLIAGRKTVWGGREYVREAAG
jgi:cellulose synthase/poly-beta-1,6-N-acetylglucosamine synthase-like glycosyltransferase